ncbi:MAG: hypothetical protein SFY68_12485 [Candidatus Sumerlaeia bacterium]|nr:hypothetical protein [Candidatus Sumerlaeia bacterium]
MLFKPVNIVLMVLMIPLFIILTQMIHNGLMRKKVAEIHADQKLLATAIETYYIDNMQYPSNILDAAQSVDLGRIPNGGVATRTFRMHVDKPMAQPSTLTSPIAYITEYPKDLFSHNADYTHRYESNTRGWIVGSFGPDKDHLTGGDIPWFLPDVLLPRMYPENPPYPVEPILRTYIDEPAKTLTGGWVQARTIFPTLTHSAGAFSYDPTNGTISEGDIWRLRE